MTPGPTSRLMITSPRRRRARDRRMRDAAGEGCSVEIGSVCASLIISYSVSC
jgi:hypothetical protein